MRYSYSSRNFLGKTCHNSCVLVYISNRIMILAAHMLGGMLPCERILKKCAIQCVLVNILIRFCIKFGFFKGDIFL